MTKDKILAALPSLSRPELTEVEAAVRLLLGGAVEPASSGPDQELYDAVCEHTGVKFFARTHAWRAPAEAALEFISANFPEAYSSKVTRVAMIRFLVGVLCEYLKERNIVAPALVARSLNLLPVAFEKGFPGYLQAGVAQVIPQTMQKRGEDNG